MTTSIHEDRQRIIDASHTQPFRFEQGASLHVGILGMVGRPSGIHDEDPYVTGTWHTGRSRCDLDLSQLQAPGEDSPAPTVWFETTRAALDISAAFAGVPAEAMSGSGIPTAVLNGPVAVDRTGDAGDGIVAMLTQMCAGKLVLDPHALLDVIESTHLESFQEHQIENSAPLRAFNAGMSIQAFLDAVALTRNMLVNQIAALGYDLRRELGPSAIDALDDYLDTARVQLAWLVDEHGRVHTAQVVLAMTDFINELFTSEGVVAQLASEEQVTVDEMTEFVATAAEAGQLVYVNAIWQKFFFADAERGVDVVAWPDAVDLSADVASQASRLRKGVDSAGPVTVDPGMRDAMAASSGAMHFVLSAVDGDAVAAMQAAQAAVMDVRHPDEPDEPLASFASDVVAFTDGAQFWADISDMEEMPLVLDQVLASVVGAVSSIVVRAHLGASEVL